MKKAKKIKKIKKPRINAKVETSTLPKNFFSLFKKEALLLANKQNKKFADELVKEAKSIIRKQSFKWKPLTDKYAKYKKRKGLDHRILVATRDYLNNGIGTWKQDGFIFAGPLPGIHKPSGLTYKYLARIHEFGTETIPARPLWRPLHSRMIRKRKTFSKAYREGVLKAAARLAKMRKKKVRM